MTTTMRYSAASSRSLTDDGTRKLVASYTGRYAAVIPDFKMQPGMLYTQVRAISARINQNYDAWPSEELKKSFRTFLGKPVFVNHQNFDPEKARGRVVAARYRENGDDKYIEVIQEIDAQRFPKLAKEIHEGGLDSVSMGVEAGFTKCSICDNRATDISDMCDHVKYHKGEKLAHAKTGEPTLVYENCFKLGFFELSYVFDPADETAVVSRVVVASRRTASVNWLIDPRDFDPNKPVHVHTMRHHVKRGIPEIWSIGQKGKDGQPRVIAYADEVPMKDVRFRVQPGGHALYQRTMNDDGTGGDRVVHAWADGYWIPQLPEGLANESAVDYHPKGQPNFYHVRDDSPISEASFVHFRPDKKVLAYSPDNWGVRVSALEPYPQRQLLTASIASDMDWADLGRQAYEQGGPPHAEDDSEIAEILDGLPPEEVDFICSRYEQGYEMAERSSLRSAARSEEEEATTMSTMQTMTPGEMMGMPSAPTSYDMTPGAGWVDPDSVGPVGGGSSSGGSSSGVGNVGGGNVGDGGIMDSARGTYNQLRELFPDADIGGYRPPGDGFDEHANGALDIMTTDQSVANQVIDVAFSNGHPYVIWEQQQINAPWYNGGAVTSMQDRGDPTQNHFDHVHIAPMGWQGATPPDGWTYNGRQAMRRHAWGEVEAPEDIDTLRDEAADNDSDDFHHYVESPEELQTPDFDQAKRLDRAQENAGLDADRRVEDVEEVGIPTRKGGKKMPQYRYAEEAPMDPSMMDPAMMGGDPSGGQPPIDPSLGAMSPEEELALLNQAQGDLAYAESELYGGEPAGEEMDPSMMDPAMMGGDPSMMDPSMGQGADPTSIPPQIQAYRRPVRSAASQNKERRTQKGRPMGINLSERGRVASRGRRIQADESGHVDGGPYGRNDQGEQEEVFLSQTPAEQAPADPVGDKQISNTENTLVARVQAGTAQLRRDAAALAYLRKQKAASTRRQAGEHSLDTAGPDAVNPYTGGSTFGPIDVRVGEPVAPTGPQHAARRYVAMCRQAGVRPTQQGFRRFYAECCEEPTTVNPDLSGTDEQSLKGDDFDSVALDNVQTQPKDASIHAFAAFDDWLARTTGKTARQHGNANFIRRQAARYIRATGVPLGNLFPTLEKVLVEARKVEANREANMKRKADMSLDVAAPGDRINVEAPVKNVTDADAQASQYDLSDYGNNAGDGIADPDLSTDSQFWAPGNGEKTSNRTADAVAAVRCAEAYINAGLAPASEKWKLIARFQTMRHATVVDRTRLLEAKNEVDRSAASQRSAAVSRGTSIPRGLGSGQRTAQTNRVAANDPSSDALLFFK